MKLKAKEFSNSSELCKFAFVKQEAATGVGGSTSRIPIADLACIVMQISIICAIEFKQIAINTCAEAFQNERRAFCREGATAV